MPSSRGREQNISAGGYEGKTVGPQARARMCQTPSGAGQCRRVVLHSPRSSHGYLTEGGGPRERVLDCRSAGIRRTVLQLAPDYNQQTSLDFNL